MEKEKLKLELLEQFFASQENTKLLKEFTLNVARKFDYNKITTKVYHQNIDDLGKVINYEINNQIIPNNNKYQVKLKLSNINEIIIEKPMILNYIYNQKYTYYVGELAKILDLNESLNEDDILDKYVTIFGDEMLSSMNVIILSKLLNKDMEYTKSRIISTFERIQTKYQYKKLKNSLINSNIKYDNNKTLAYVDKLNGFEFEDYLKRMFEKFNYRIEQLPYSGDYGADLIMQKGFNKVVIQAKNYTTSNVGNRAVQEVLGAKEYYKCDIAVVMTNSYFTKNAIELAKKTSVILIDRNELGKILNQGVIYFDNLVQYSL